MSGPVSRQILPEMSRHIPGRYRAQVSGAGHTLFRVISASPTDLQTSGRRWLALAVLILGVVMGMLDTTVVNVALPTIRTSIDASEATLSWIISGYALAYGLILIPAGRLGDRIGHKWVFAVGLTGFTLSSLACGLADDGTALVVARVAQGLFGGLFFPAVTALIQLMFAGRERGKAFAVMGAAIGVSTALGPIIGGLLIEWLGDTDGWRSIFFVNLPFGAVAIAAALLILPGGAEGGDARGADGLGFLLLAGALVALLVPLIEGQDQNWPLWTWLSLAGGAVLAVIFAVWEVALTRRARTTPLVPPHLFAHPAFTSIFFTISILWQAGLGFSALESGIVSIPFALGSIVGASFSDRVAHRLGRTALVIGTGLVAVGLTAVWLVLLLVPATDLTNWELLAPLAVAGIGSGLFIAPNAQFIVATVDRTEAGAASGVIGTMQRIGSAIGIAVIGSVLFGTLDIAGPNDVADAFAASAAHAMLVSAVFAVAAFALVFVLPKRVAPGYERAIPGE
jgi:EmrB/QacA subfamily drug resistance transporter